MDAPEPETQTKELAATDTLPNVEQCLQNSVLADTAINANDVSSEKVDDVPTQDNFNSVEDSVADKVNANEILNSCVESSVCDTVADKDVPSEQPFENDIESAAVSSKPDEIVADDNEGIVSNEIPQETNSEPTETTEMDTDVPESEPVSSETNLLETADEPMEMEQEKAPSETGKEGTTEEAMDTSPPLEKEKTADEQSTLDERAGPESEEPETGEKVTENASNIECNSIDASSAADGVVETEVEVAEKGTEPIEENTVDSGEDKSQQATPQNEENTSENSNDKNETTDKETALQTNGSVERENEDSNRDNPIFEHVNTEKEDSNKEASGTDQTNQEEDDFRNSQPQEDPIASDMLETPVPAEDDDSSKDIDESEQGADEELCIIPDTERVISQAEKEAAAAMARIRNSSGLVSILKPNNSVAGPISNIAKDETFVINKCKEETTHTCVQCLLSKVSKFVSTTDKRTIYICDDNCLSTFQDENPGKVSFPSTGDLRVKNLAPEVTEPSVESKVISVRKCGTCNKKIQNTEYTLSWEAMDFCNELCLSKYQKKIGSNCSNCSTEVRSNFLGKYSVRFGCDVRQFCSSVCLEEFKKGLKVCSYCQKDISGGGDGFLAPVGDKGQFKDFCTPQCMEKYDSMNNHKRAVVRPGVTCSVCRNEKPITIEYEHESELNVFCSQPCFVAYKFVKTIVAGKCDMCRRFFDIKVLEKCTMHYDEKQYSFCSKSCMNIYIVQYRRIVPCSWCKVKKYNFDMIRRSCANGQILMMCSLNCLSLYNVSVNAVNLKKAKCDHCLQTAQPVYHLTMSDATLRNFCSYSCVMSFQSQFPKTPITLNDQEETPAPVPVVPTGGPKRTRKNANKANAEPEISMPVISNVQSLAATTNGTVSTRSTRSKSNANMNVTANSAPATPVKAQIKQQVIIKPAPLPPQKNMGTMCRPIQNTKGTNTRLVTVNKEIQTDEVKQETALIPVPVPFYVPTPLPMYTTVFPVPVPFPLPIPIPVFIPTTRNSANGIMKEIKKIQVKIPTDPFEAELLMMAEMVADDKKEENTDSESEEEDTAPAGDEGTSFSPEPADASNTFGDDMLQMALKMASELDEPAVDLEGALTANTITASQQAEAAAASEEAVDDPQPMHQMMERQSFRGRKRGIRNQRQNTPSKRGRRMSHASDMPIMAPPQHPAQQEPIEKPDANMCLKYTFGVNAWKQWVTTKNAELEKSSRRVKLFKPEILQLTADELNYSLCLFVKEVRKPNGTEYAPDTIYYLCLGIQQYLFENGRIDNIFCDAYYEKFTDCLDEVARKFSVLYNDSHYIVTRVEEEHLWESKQLGAHSPHVLLSTLMFFNTKHFNLTTVDEHMQLSFSHIMKHWKRNPNQPGTAKSPGSRNVLLRFYPPQSALANARKKKVYEQQENEENPLRCPVKLYEFYLSKCPESVKTRNDVFYLQPERSCVPDSPVWYSTMPLGREALEKMLHRVKMVKEINVALLTS